MARKVSPIKFESSRPLGIGRLTSFAESTSVRQGFLIGGNKGLYYLPDIESKPQRIRRHPVGWFLAGSNGVVCYEEVSGHGRLAILYENLTERSIDNQLARTVNPKVYWNNGLIIHHRNEFIYLDLATENRISLAEFEPSRNISPFARTADGYEFIAVHRGADWPTFLYRLTLSEEGDRKAVVTKLAQAEDPIFARIFLPLSNGKYLVIPTGQAIFQIYKVFPGDMAGLRTWSLVHIIADAHPVGGVLIGRRLWIAVQDSLMSFKLTDPPVSP